MESRVGEQGRRRRIRRLPEVQFGLRRNRQHPLRARCLARHGHGRRQRRGLRGGHLVQGCRELELVRLHWRDLELDVEGRAGDKHRGVQRDGTLLRWMGSHSPDHILGDALPGPCVPHAGRLLAPRAEGVVLLRPPFPHSHGLGRAALRRVLPRVHPVARMRLPAGPSDSERVRVLHRGVVKTRKRGRIKPLRDFPLRQRERAAAEGYAIHHLPLVRAPSPGRLGYLEERVLHALPEGHNAEHLPGQLHGVG
mmetsp:Transcript_79232/g.230076  ORF Transcript_79232/g.230076 Transcript_79232/m.230076 type:complete len:252 (+) Transcript_79232:919-1674(+)